MTMAVDDKSQREPRKFTGRMFLFCIVGFFGLIFVSNGIMMYLAIGTFPGLEVESSYKAGQRYNRELAKVRAQAKLNWKVNAAIERNNDGSALIRVIAKDKLGVPITGELVTVMLHRPAITAADQDLRLAERSAGEYMANAMDIQAGNWNVVVEIADPDGGELPIFRSKNKIYFAK
ncbi:FixH family protein [Pseudovibrio sp. Tun.PSC04-5.I4]|uniref:FixH family protein n=1 Tax=Pseudovibrio sp. Tun.PSC04-5.I4 TaxID=1798213 RepID=UPI000887FA41|nr:FixH family protein [Pseudovibrio sp. Tun.PSC04-5.I4]SDQ84914.1 Nitrogen fixation protein FixH [Pseudovibrio sp. Tun.PSC04-5.I4]